MRLADPLYLLLLVPVWIIVLLYLRGMIGKEASLKFSNVSLVRSAGVRPFSFRRIVAALLKAAALTVLVIALARPQTGKGEKEETKFVVDIMVALDISSSMATLDFQPGNRLEAAKVEAKRFIENRAHDRIGLVIFAKHGVTVSPVTTDRGALLALLNRVEMGTMEDGTAIGVGLATAVNRLKESEAKSKVVILMTDGVNNSGEIDPLTAAKIAKEYGIRVYTVGMGKEGMSLIPVNDPRFGPRLERVMTEIDEDQMTQISQMTGGKYYRAQDEQGLRATFDEIDKLEKTEVKVREFTRYEDHFAFFLWLGLAALLAELAASQLVLRRIP